MLIPDDAPGHARLTTSSAGAVSDATQRALVAASAASAKQGHDIVVLDVGPIIAIIESFVLVSATNTRPVKTIVDEVEIALKAYDGSGPLGIEGRDDATWVLLDFGDVVVHVFQTETREFYDLDRLWADAARVPYEESGALVAEG